jgi:hypothetical protein
MSIDIGVDELGSYTEDYFVNVTSASSNFQLARAPWPSPVNKKLQLLQITMSPTAGTASGSQVVFWDQDLSNSTPPTRGSAGGAMLILGCTASANSGATTVTTVFSEHQTPEMQFNAGCAIQSSTLNNSIAAVFKVI